jgi:hypothetical protein
MAEAAVLEVIAGFRDEVADLAEVGEWKPTDRLRLIEFQPKNPDAAQVTLAVSEREVVVMIGNGTRFELGTDGDDQRLMGDLLRAVAAGQVDEKAGLFGLSFKVWLADGTTHTGRILGGSRESRRYAPWRPSG